MVVKPFSEVLALNCRFGFGFVFSPLIQRADVSQKGSTRSVPFETQAGSRRHIHLSMKAQMEVSSGEGEKVHAEY